jgi:putative ABC transport system permease protein
MNIINALTLRHLKLNKKRTIVTIIGIIISVAMITAVATFTTSLLRMFQRTTIEDTGNWHVQYKNVSGKNVNIVLNDENTASAALSKDIGYALLDGLKNEHKPYLFVKSLDRQGFENFNLDLIEGRLPENSNEIVISSHIAENGGVVKKIGDALKLKVGERYLVEGGKKITLGQDWGLVEPSADRPGERFTAKSTKEYMITGIINRPNIEPYVAPGYTVITYLDKSEVTSSDPIDISVALHKVTKKIFKQSNELARTIGISEGGIVYNNELLRYYGVITNDNLLKTLYTVAAIVIILIIIGSVSLIYNAFAISTSERSRHMGMLASVGATKKQKRNSVFFEGFIVGMIGIPIGVIFGTLGIGVTLILVRPLIEGVIKGAEKLTLVTSPAAILVAVLLSGITIFVSAYIPARRAAKISPVESIRQSQDIKLTGRTVKTSKLTRRIFGFEAELGLKNLKRNSRRYKATIFSLVLSIVLFLSVSALSMLTQKSTSILTGDIPYEVQVMVTSSASAEEKKDFYNAITKLDFVDEYVIEQTMVAELNADRHIIPDEIKSILDSGGSPRRTYKIAFQIKSIDSAALQRYAKELGVDVVSLKDITNPKGILINWVDVMADNKFKRIKHFNIAVGESLALTHEIANDPPKPGKHTSILQVAALAGKTPIGETALRNPGNAVLIVSEEVYAGIKAKLPKSYRDTKVEMLIKSSNPAKLVKSIGEYQKRTLISNVFIHDVTEREREAKQVKTFVYVFFYGFIVLITAICVANIFNTISTSISLRKREFSMLKSVGMTPEGFSKMINYESMFYGIKALTYGLPISFVSMYLIYIALSNSFVFPFTVPRGSVFRATSKSCLTQTQRDL